MVMEEPAFITLSISEYKAICDYSLRLEARIKNLEAHIMALEASQKALEARQNAAIDHLARSISEDRRRLAKLENRPIKEHTPLIDELYSHMRSVGLKQTTFSGAAKILKRSKGRINQLHPALAMDKRFIIIQSESHKQRLLIRIREV